MNRDRRFWTDFIDLYRALPSLWRRGSKEYANKCLKAQAYQQLVAKLRERYPKADRQTAIKKINCFRTNYRREKRMLDIHRRAGERCSTTLWFFHQLRFLDKSLHWKGSREMSEELEEGSEDQDIYSPWPKQLNYEDYIELYDEMLVDSDCDSEEDGLQENLNFWQEFLQIYKGLPSLWNTDSFEYWDWQQKSRDYKVLVDKLREIYPRAASMDMAKRRINHFRSAFHREHRKVLDAESSMLTYVPKLWCYNLLLFLSNHLESNDDLIEEEAASQQKDFRAVEDSHEAVSCSELNRFDNRTPKEFQSSTSSQKSNNSSILEDPIALSWSAQYKEMDQHQKVLARKLIGDILFQGCLGNLSVELTQAVQKVFNP
ncbi:uncharacterized protein [Drosophila kikkawai]|uniref:MADF domain-containing protein n=1 Tax=Drosophila kikkawai TaxID=30033 RepID=A0A6P4J4V4_DROKI|nr:uncharacterized protein LOC108080234 [Drosophila kikkawai]